MYQYFKLAFCLVIICFILQINNLFAEEYVKINAKPSALIVKQGDTFLIRLSMKFKENYYTYSLEEQLGPEGIGPLPTEIKVMQTDILKIVGKIKPLNQHTKYDDGFKMKVNYFNKLADFDIPVKALKQINFNYDIIGLAIDMQICQGTSCMPPELYKVVVSKEIFIPDNSKIEEIKDITEQNNSDSIAQAQTINQEEKTQSATISNNTSVNNQETNTGTNNSQGDLLSVILIAIAMGAASLLTPCVFPMVPITVSFFTKRTEQNKGKGLRDALVYALGIIITFTGLGIIFSLIFGASGIQNFTNSAWVNLFIFAIFIVFALSMFGAFELQLPSGLINKLNTKSNQGSGIGSVVLMGLTFSLASFSCTGPLVGTALVTAASGDWFYPTISMLAFSTVLAAPFFLLALFPNALKSMPKAGGWMNNVKVVLALILTPLSLKFLNGAFAEWGFEISRDLFLGFWVGCSLLIVVYLLGIFKMQHDSPVNGVSTGRIIFVMIFAGITFYLLSGLFGKPMGVLEGFLPAPEENVQTTGIAPLTEDIWYDNLNDAIAQANKQNKNIFIDFTGKHCTNCRMMERNMFPKAGVNQAMNKMIKVKLITDMPGEPWQSNKKFQSEKFSSVAIPLYVVYSPNGDIIAKEVFTNDEQKFIDFLKKGAK